MNIKDAAIYSGLPTKTIRYYDEIGLVTPPRDANGYRAFREPELHRLVFVAHARALGFTIDDCRALLMLYDDDQRASADVKRIANEHLQRIESKISDLETMRETLSHLIDKCHGDQRPDCPILENFRRVHEAE